MDAGPSPSSQEQNEANDEIPRRLTQAERVINRFGGIPALVKALHNAGFTKQRAAIYKWTYAKGQSGGTGGIIPTQNIPEILKAAELEGVILTANDLDPRGDPPPRKRMKTGPKPGWRQAKREQLLRLQKELAEVEALLAARENVESQSTSPTSVEPSTPAGSTEPTSKGDEVSA